jgi:hypothetical protein
LRVQSILTSADIRVLFDGRREFVLGFLERNSIQLSFFRSVSTLLSLYGVETFQPLAGMRFGAGWAIVARS